MSINTMAQTVLFFGDSLTAGYGLKNTWQESMPALIKQKITLAGIDAKVINAGISGDTTTGGLARLDSVLNQPVEIFVLELGINDAIRGIAPPIILKNLQAIVNKVKAAHPTIKLVLLGMEIPVFLRGDFADEFRSIFRQLAAINDMAFVPFMLAGVAGKKDLNLFDRLHPNAEGYKIIADNIWPVINKLLK
jgi:acyl-CoA thioesterase-1